MPLSWLVWNSNLGLQMFSFQSGVRDVQSKASASRACGGFVTCLPCSCVAKLGLAGE